MAGQWIYKVGDNHACALPDLDESIEVGDIWRCGFCSCSWRVEHIEGEAITWNHLGGHV